jgi:hypothetical protein
MGLPFDGPADEVKAHLDSLTGVIQDVRTNLMSYLEGEGYLDGSLDDKLKSWLVHETELSSQLSLECLLQVYLVSLGYTSGALVDLINSAAKGGQLFPPPFGSGFVPFIVTDDGGSTFKTSDGDTFGVRASHVQFVVTDAGGSNFVTSQGNNFLSKE